MNKESIIGRKYKPIDNSYSYCITDGHRYNAEKHYLAGIDKVIDEGEYERWVSDIPAKLVTILSEPFKVNIQVNVSNEQVTYKEHEMILVIDDLKYHHIILFYEKGLI
jgi:hypothetical protein